MRRARWIVLATAALLAVVFLLDWTIGALDVMQMRRLADLRRARAAMVELESGALVLAPRQRLLLGDGEFRFATNSRGRRISGYPPSHSSFHSPKPSYLLLGDAATLGWGVDDSLSFARRLESLLEDRVGHVDVLNAGQLFLRPADLASVLEARGDAPAPVLDRLGKTSLVVVCGPSSANRLPPRWWQIAEQREEPRPWWGGIWPSIWGMKQRIGDGLVEVESLDLAAAGWREGLAGLQALCRERGQSLIALDLGVPEFVAICASLGLPCRSIGPDRRERQAGLFRDATERVPNVMGHVVLARRGADALADRSWAKSR